MRQEVAHRVHDADGGFAVLDADVDVEAEDEVGAGDELEVFDDLGVAGVGIDLLDAPVGEGMGGAGDEDEAVLVGEGDHVAAELEDVFAASWMLRQMRVPTSMTDLCISALTRSSRRILPLASISVCDVRAEIAGLGVDGLVFLFDA